MPLATSFSKTKEKFIICKIIRAEQTHQLRQKILRPQQPIEEMVYPNDGLEGSFHLGAIKEDEIVGIVSVYPESHDGEIGQGEWRIRGMAVESRLQGQGVGRLLVEEAINHAKIQGATSIWCNARTSAIGFYLSFGFDKVGDEFEIKGIGPHYIARLPL